MITNQRKIQAYNKTKHKIANFSEFSFIKPYYKWLILKGKKKFNLDDELKNTTHKNVETS